MLFSRMAPLIEQFTRMIRVLKVLIAVITAPVPGDQLLVMVNAEPVGIGLEDHGLSGIVRRHGVAIAFKLYAKLVGGAQ